MARTREHGLIAALWGLLRTPVPSGHRGYLAFGWLILALFLVQIVTGILLSFYYESASERASASVAFMMRDVNWGWLIRGTHHWASHGVIVLGLVQMVRVFLQGSYRGARGSNWMIGLLLLFLFLVFAYTGELLTWDNDAYWSATAALDQVQSFPLLGPALAPILRGGNEVTAHTLSRFYSAHVLLLPWLTFFLILINIWLLARPRPQRGGL